MPFKQTWSVKETSTLKKIKWSWLSYYNTVIIKLASSARLATHNLHSVTLLNKFITLQPQSLSVANPINKWKSLTKPLSTGRLKTLNVPCDEQVSGKAWRWETPDQSKLLKIFYHSLSFTCSSWIRDFRTHSAFKLLFMHYRGGEATIINAEGYFSRWKHTYLLLFNLFYTRESLPTFGSRVFKTEILALNWSFKLLTYKIFKFAAPFFIFNDEDYGLTPSLVLDKWKQKNINYVFLLELKIFKKLRYFFKTYSLFTFGLVPMNTNPWLVSYPIPAFSDTKLVQYYFLKLILLIRQDALHLKFYSRYKLWSQFKLN